MTYIIVFFTHSGAIKFEKKMQKLDIPCLLQPVPRKLSSSCGICAKITFNGNTDDLVESEVESIYKDISKNQYELMYMSSN
ncbi:MAG: DUF3343 domain-containing protein [Sedimentibacter sp.]|uniref:DUF3343 domain-containing protein n=1 Tax=Sedimentibacter sp. TaxID=1960295 RepID=UPI00298156A4|nr:DUF3343 domain-containing protein [Sedimentibacter sp.]MDW5300191.1 DUF3343 domain-containing protein [Sedimentibacter sp.]